MSSSDAVNDVTAHGAGGGADVDGLLVVSDCDVGCAVGGFDDDALPPSLVGGALIAPVSRPALLAMAAGADVEEDPSVPLDIKIATIAAATTTITPANAAKPWWRGERD